MTVSELVANALATVGLVVALIGFAIVYVGETRPHLIGANIGFNIAFTGIGFCIAGVLIAP